MGQDAVLHIRLYTLCWPTISHLYSHKTPLHLFYLTTSNKFNFTTVYYPLWHIITVKVTYTTISANRSRCRLICPSFYISLTQNIPHIFKLTPPSFFLFHNFKQIWPYYCILSIMKHHNRQGGLQYHLRRYAEMPSHMCVCIRYVDI